MTVSNASETFGEEIAITFDRWAMDQITLGLISRVGAWDERHDGPRVKAYALYRGIREIRLAEGLPDIQPTLPDEYLPDE